MKKFIFGNNFAKKRNAKGKPAGANNWGPHKWALILAPAYFQLYTILIDQYPNGAPQILTVDWF